MFRSRRRRRARPPKPGLDAIVATALAAGTIITLYIDQDEWDVVIPFSLVVLIVYVWVTRFR